MKAHTLFFAAFLIVAGLLLLVHAAGCLSARRAWIAALAVVAGGAVLGFLPGLL